MEAVYIIHQGTGNCIVFRKYGDLEFNEDLIAGFLTALKDFSSEVTGGKGKMKNLDMGDYNILLLYHEGILVAGALGRRDDESIAHKALTSVLTEFFNNFKDIVPTWNGNLKVFKGFDKKVDKLTENGKIAEKELLAPFLKKKLPKQIVTMGAITEDEFEFSEYLNGKNTAEDIAEQAGIPVEKVEVMIAKFKDLGFVKFNKL
ncbi:hypothetical protein GF325_15515 [Candidatus Bathyarchaeota archaeon]|nr:hypothetical protein [Candidatus Bathyarchaeota archaeon]